MKKLLFLLLLLPSLVLADSTRYINTDCTTFNGDGSASTCAASGGGVGAYSTCALAESDIQSDFTNDIDAANTGVITLDAQGLTADGQCTFAGFNPSATDYILFQTSGSNRPSVAPWIDTTKYRLVTSAGGAALQINVAYMRINGIQAQHTATGSGAYSGLADDTAAGLSLVVNNSIFEAANCTGGGNCEAFKFYPNVANTRLTLVNNIAISKGVSSNSAAFYLRASGVNNGEITIAHNNGAYGGVYGFRYDGNGASDARYRRNNWAQGNTTGYFTSSAFTTDTSSTNISEDATSPDASFRNLAITFTSEGTQDFTLAAGDTAAKGAGTDLSADAQYPFSTDLVGLTRSVPWDIGPLKFYTAPTPTPTPSVTSRKGQKCADRKGQCLQ